MRERNGNQKQAKSANFAQVRKEKSTEKRTTAIAKFLKRGSQESQAGALDEVRRSIEYLSSEQ